MARLILVRHGEASAGWAHDRDPGLSPAGRQQAAAMAEAVDRMVAGEAGERRVLPVITSPLRRTRETASALEGRWDTTAVVDPGVGEIPSPAADLAERGAWLTEVLAARWSELGEDEQRWRSALLQGLHSIATAHGDTVVVTHFVAINVAIGAATGDDRVLVRSVANCSRTVVDVAPGGSFVLVAGGDEAETVVG